MAKARTKKKRLDNIEKDLGEVKAQVMNHIPTKLNALEETDSFIFEKVCKTADIVDETREDVKGIVNTLIKYTPFAGPSKEPGA